MLEQLHTLYSGLKWVKFAIWIGVLALGILLFIVSGGFPAQAWRLLWQTVPLVPRLWSLKGNAIVLPLFQLTALSLAILCCWGFLVAAIIWLGRQEWHDYCEQKEFDASLERAEALSIQDLSIQDLSARTNDEQFVRWWEGQTEEFPAEALKATGTTGQQVMPRVAPVMPLPMTSQPITGPLVARPTSKPEPTATLAHKGLSFVVGTGLDAGIKRKHKPNEDNLLAIQGMHTYNNRDYPFGLFVIADGMGGHSKGQEASRLAIQHIREVIMPTLLSDAEIDGDQARELLLDGIQHANLAVYQYNQAHAIDMGTTVTAALMIDKTIAIANVGDSRTYRFNQQDGLQQVTKDHSLVAQLLARGDISEDDVYVHPQRNEIYRCIGEKASVQADTFTVALQAGTTLLLCSDGLWEMVKKPTLEQVLRETLPDAPRTSKALISAALHGGGLDNISVIVLHISGTGSQSDELQVMPQPQHRTVPPLASNGWGRR